jgi:hypothetical protein
MENDVLRAALTGAGVVLLQRPYRAFAIWLFETVTRRLAYAAGWTIGGLGRLVVKAATGRYRRT